MEEAALLTRKETLIPMPAFDGNDTDLRTARVRLLQTTDLHMQIMPFDYNRLAPTQTSSLAHLLAPIAAMRNEGIPSVLVDTGDFLQGNALADAAIASDGPHPMITAFNDLGYDAVVLGNHDFDYGLSPLRTALAGLTCPVLAANVAASDGGALAVATAIIPVRDQEETIQVGLLGLTTTPPATACNPANPPFVHFTDPLEVAQENVDLLRSEGADVVVALCHFGIDPDVSSENVADKVALIDGVDAIFTGHTHDDFPGEGIAQSPGIDPNRGRLYGVPCVMSGVFGRAIGKIDVSLSNDGGGWRVTDATCEVVRPPAVAAPPTLKVAGLSKLHDATLKVLRGPVTETHVPLSTAFSMIAPDLGQLLLANARMDAIRTALVGTPYAAASIVGTAAPYQAGTKDDPTLFLNVQPGALTKHDIQCIFPYKDPVIGLLQSGEQVVAWLEASARRFLPIKPGVHDQPLVDPAFAPYDFKTVFGLTYTIDPTCPFGARVKDIRFQGTPVAPDQHFVVATTPNHLRGQDLSKAKNVLCMTPQTSQDILESYLRSNGPVLHAPPSAWRFASVPDTKAQFVSTSDADLAHAPRGVIAGPMRGKGLQEFTYSFDVA